MDHFPRQRGLAPLPADARLTVSGRAIELRGSLTIRDAAETLDRLKAELADVASLTIDCSALTEADLSIVQLLAALQASATAEGKSVRLVAPAGRALRALLQQSGLLETPDAEAPGGGAILDLRDGTDLPVEPPSDEFVILDDGPEELIVVDVAPLAPDSAEKTTLASTRTAAERTS